MAGTEQQIRIVLVDDQTLIRDGLKFIIDSQPDMQVAGEAGDGEEAVLVARRTSPDLVLMDVQMPKASGIEATARILSLLPDVKIVLLTTFDVQDYVFDGIRAGACGYLLKDTPTKELLASIRSIAEGAALFNSKLAGSVLLQMSQLVGPENAPHADESATGRQGDQAAGQSSQPAVSGQPSQSAIPGRSPQSPSSAQSAQLVQAQLAEPLTDREIEVLQLMGYGRKNAEIARTLYVSEGTVKTHVHNIIQKLGVEDRTQAVVLAIRSGLIK